MYEIRLENGSKAMLDLTPDEWFMYCVSSEYLQDTDAEISERLVQYLMSCGRWSRDRVVDFVRKVKEQKARAIAEQGEPDCTINYEQLSVEGIQAFWENSPEGKVGFIYLVGVDEVNRYKIGLTVDVHKRFSQFLNSQFPFPIRLLHTFSVKNCRLAEKTLHGKFSKKRVHGEWFELNQADVNFICSIPDQVQVS